jgi:hypothetical protein
MERRGPPPLAPFRSRSGSAAALAPIAQPGSPEPLPSPPYGRAVCVCVCVSVYFCLFLCTRQTAPRANLACFLCAVRTGPCGVRITFTAGAHAFPWPAVPGAGAAGVGPGSPPIRTPSALARTLSVSDTPLTTPLPLLPPPPPELLPAPRLSSPVEVRRHADTVREYLLRAPSPARPWPLLLAGVAGGAGAVGVGGSVGTGVPDVDVWAPQMPLPVAVALLALAVALVLYWRNTVQEGTPPSLCLRRLYERERERPCILKQVLPLCACVSGCVRTRACVCVAHTCTC